MAVSDDDDDGSIGPGDCEADGRIVIMIPVLLAALCLAFTSTSCFFLSHRESDEVEGDQDKRLSSHKMRSNSVAPEEEQKDEAEGDRDKENHDVDKEAEENEDDDEGDSRVEALRFLSKVVALAVGVGAESLALTDVAFVLKALPFDTSSSDSSSRPHCAPRALAASLGLAVATSAVASIGMCRAASQIAKEMVPDVYFPTKLLVEKVEEKKEEEDDENEGGDDAAREDSAVSAKAAEDEGGGGEG